MQRRRGRRLLGSVRRRRDTGELLSVLRRARTAADRLRAEGQGRGRRRVKIRQLIEISRRIDRLFALAAGEKAKAARCRSPRVRKKRLDRAARLIADASALERRCPGQQLGLALADEPDARGAPHPEMIKAVRRARSKYRDRAAGSTSAGQ